MKIKNKFKLALATLLPLSMIAVAVNLNDMQVDAEGQKVISLYGNYEDPNNPGSWITQYNDAVLTIPEEIICLFRQVWKPELVGLGDVRVEINDKKCVGNEEGRAVINGVFNINLDPLTGKTIGKLWLDDANSLIYPNKDVTAYMKLSVDSSPTSSEPFGRFVLDVVDEDRANTSSPLFVARVTAEGATFKVAGRMPTTSFSGYADAIARKGIYRFTGQPSTVLGYNEDHICFKKGTQQEDCFPRKLSESLTNPHVKLNAWEYGIYDDDGLRYEVDTTGVPLRFTENGLEKVYELFGGFGGHLRYIGAGMGDPNYGGRPGGSSSNGSDMEFWSNKIVAMDNPGGPPISVRLQWLMKTHSVHPLAAKRINDQNINAVGILLDASESVLLDPAALDAANAKSIGSMPSSVLSAPLKVKAGRIL